MAAITTNTRRGSAGYNVYLHNSSNGTTSTDDRDRFTRRIGTTI